MRPRPFFVYLCIPLFFVPLLSTAQNLSAPKSPPKTALDSLMLVSGVLVFKQSSISADTAKATLRVRVYEKSSNIDPIQGATVLLRRDKDKMLGRVTKYDGRCLFEPAPSTYAVRVQMTGLKSFEETGFKLEAGKVYDMEIVMARN